MQLTLENFKKHRSTTITIPANGMVVITGNNGVGKTTLMKAIAHAFYGNISKPYTYGYRSCKVKLILSDISIERTDKKHLVVEYQNKKYEDAAAQGVINGYLGMTESIFNACCMCSQRSALKNSVISLPPTEQLNFIEAMKPRNEALALQVKENIKCRKEAYDDACRTYDIVKGVCDSMANITENTLDQPPRDPATIQKDITITKSKLQVIDKTMEEHKAEIQASKIYAEVEAQISKIETETNQLRTLKQNLGVCPEPSTLLKKEAKLKAFQSSILTTKLADRIVLLEKEVEALKLEHTSTIKEEIAALGDITPPSVDYLEKEKEYETYIQEKATYDNKLELVQQSLANCVDFIKSTYGDKAVPKTTKAGEIASLSVFLSKKQTQTEKEIVLLEAPIAKVMVCPKCSVSVILNGEELKVCEPEPKKPEPKKPRAKTVVKAKDPSLLLQRQHELANIKTLLASLEGLTTPKAPSTCINKEEVAELRDAIKKYEYTKAALAVLNKKLGELPKSLVVKQKELVGLKAKLPKGFVKQGSVEELQQKEVVKSAKLTHLSKLKGDHTSFDKEINAKERSLADLRRKLPKQSLLKKVSPMEVVDELMTEKGVLSATLSGLYEELSTSKEYVSYVEEVKKHAAAKAKLGEAECAKEKATNEYEGALGVKEAEKEARIIRTENTVAEINHYAAKYLALLFDTPIVVRLCCEEYAPKGKRKLKLNTVVEYDGEILDSVDDLSDGLLQRCELAFFLGMNEMFKGKFVFFDETLNRIDPNAGPLILNKIKNISNALNKDLASSKAKLFLFIAHEAVKGVFDEVIELGVNHFP